MLNVLKRRAEIRRQADRLAEGIVARSRLPVFYGRLGVADTIDGRFDLLALHAWLVLDRLATQKAQSLSQSLIDGLFVQFDEALRQQGAGDMGMSRRMTKMADAFYGRLKAYGEAGDHQALAEAVQRNVFRGDAGKVEQSATLAIYATAARARLADADLAAGALDFGAEP
jgi:cytochrome b pre-mRNA-processing protein 3